MIYAFDHARLEAQSVHLVGAEAEGGELVLSGSPLVTDDETEAVMMRYFLSAFKTDELFCFSHSSDLAMNEVFTLVSRIFDQPDTLHEQSAHIARFLHECSTHPNIKSGEFYVVYFRDCILEGEMMDAVGLFKSEHKASFLKVKHAGSAFQVAADQGVNVNQLDKGCLIFNTEGDSGFAVAVVDKTNKGSDARYWKDDFLHLSPRADEYHFTSNAIELCKSFISKEMPQNFEVSPADQADLLNRSAQFFKEHEEFSIEEYAGEVIVDKQVIDEFTRYKSDFEQQREVEVGEGFAISGSAVKKQSRVFRSVIKLDKNFHIYVHGNREMIERGVDADGRKYYKVYFDEEN
jgi:hypothetical protein